jgi:hypothetical protein
LGDSSSIAERLARENARIAVLNGSSTSGLAKTTGDYLVGRDFQIVQVGDASVLHENTLIIDHTGKRYTSRQLATLLHLPLSSVVVGGTPNGDYDVSVILGNDFQVPEG